jgi:hypothetical protein
MARHSRSVHESSYHDRTARLLEDRLESLACACEHSLIGVRALDTEMLRAAVATAHAVRLSLLSPEEAVTIWTAVAERHPDVPSFVQGLELELLGPN